MIYFIQAGKNGPIKIGQSDNPKERLNQLQTANPYELKLLWVYRGDEYNEAKVQALFEHEQIRGEWYHPSKRIFDFISGDLENDYSIALVNGGFIYVCEHYPIGTYLSFRGIMLAIEDDVATLSEEDPPEMTLRFG